MFSCYFGEFSVTRFLQVQCEWSHIQRVKIVINDNIIEQVTDFGGTNFILRIKEQKTRLILNEHDDDDDDDDGYWRVEDKRVK